jgi:hypothetical protein
MVPAWPIPLVTTGTYNCGRKQVNQENGEASITRFTRRVAAGAADRIYIVKLQVIAHVSGAERSKKFRTALR